MSYHFGLITPIDCAIFFLDCSGDGWIPTACLHGMIIPIALSKLIFMSAIYRYLLNNFSLSIKRIKAARVVHRDASRYTAGDYSLLAHAAAAPGLLGLFQLGRQQQELPQHRQWGAASGLERGGAAQLASQVFGGL